MKKTSYETQPVHIDSDGKISFLISKRNYASIIDGVKEIIEGTFTETTIKMLFLDLREFARLDLKGTPYDLTSKSVKEFIDVADFIAHPYRHKGEFETAIRLHVQKYLVMFECVNTPESINIPFSGVSTFHILDGFLTVLGVFLLINNALDTDAIMDLGKHNDEISLCIISLLNDSTVVLKGMKALAHLKVFAYKGKFSLYCSILSKKISLRRNLRLRLNNPLVTHDIEYQMGFAILQTNCIDHNKLFPDEFPIIIFENEESIHNAPLVQTYRDLDELNFPLKLRFRHIKIGEGLK